MRVTGPGPTAALGPSPDGETGVAARKFGHNQTTQGSKMGMVIIACCSRATRLETSTGLMLRAT